MQLTRHTDYAFRVLIFAAVHPERLVTISEMAEAYSISRNHLVKVVHEMGQHGFIETQRGKGGGIRLARPPREIGLADVVRAMEEKLEIIDCGATGCPILPACALRDVLYEARDAFLASLGRHTLQDIIDDKNLLPLLGGA
jgi:Rrf2 family nitric oxide-sensitive transcriptional repressor